VQRAQLLCFVFFVNDIGVNIANYCPKVPLSWKRTLGDIFSTEGKQFTISIDISSNCFVMFHSKVALQYKL